VAASIRFTGYARKRLGRRTISEEAVLAVVRHPDQLIEERGRKVAQTRWVTPRGKEYLLRVVYEESGDEIVIVTIYDTSKIQKYWRT
jgi:hypothetical protein